MKTSAIAPFARAAACTAVLTLAAAPPAVQAQERVNLVFNGIPAANDVAAPGASAFGAWCGGICFPTTKFPVFDPATGVLRGQAAVWARSFQPGAGGSLCFSEYIVFSLSEGQVQIRSGTNGTCGAPIDPTLKPPLHPELGAQVVIAGGGDGQIVTGTGRFENWTGTFSDRVFVGFGPPTAGVGGIVYYDQLWFSLSRR